MTDKTIVLLIGIIAFILVAVLPGWKLKAVSFVVFFFCVLSATSPLVEAFNKGDSTVTTNRKGESVITNTKTGAQVVVPSISVVTSPHKKESEVSGSADKRVLPQQPVPGNDVARFKDDMPPKADKDVARFPDTPTKPNQDVAKFPD